MRATFPRLVKYWPKGSDMLAQVQLEDSRISEFPPALIDAIGSVEDVTQSCVVFSSYAGLNSTLWDDYLTQGEQLITELQQNFPRAAGQDRNIVYHVERIPGYLGDDDLMKYVIKLLQL